MSKIEQVMDKYWIEFLTDEDFETYLSNADYNTDAGFWVWFKESHKGAKSLENYL